MRFSYDQNDGPDFYSNLGEIMQSDIKPTFAIDRNFLVEMDIQEEVEEAFEVSGWSNFPELTMTTNEEDTREFLASVAMDREEGLRYRHRGTYYTASREDFINVFGWIWPDEHNVDNHSNREAWSGMSRATVPYTSGRSRATDIVNPAIYYLYKVMVHSVTGRFMGAFKPSIADMEILRGFYFQTVVDWCKILWAHWVNLNVAREIYVGGVITHYLNRMHGIPPLGHHVITEGCLLTREKMHSLRIIRIKRNGVAQWKFHEPNNQRAEEREEEPEEERAEEVEEPHPLRRCTRSTTRNRQRREQEEPRAEYQPWDETQQWADAAQGVATAPQWTGAQPSPRDAQRDHTDTGYPSGYAYGYEQGGSSTQVPSEPNMNDWMFNVTRLMEHLAPPSADMYVRAPDLWTPGQQVPSGYHLWDDTPRRSPSYDPDTWVNSSDLSPSDGE